MNVTLVICTSLCIWSILTQFFAANEITSFLQEHTMIGYRDTLYIFGGEVGFSNGVETPLWTYNITVRHILYEILILSKQSWNTWETIIIQYKLDWMHLRYIWLRKTQHKPCSVQTTNHPTVTSCFKHKQQQLGKFYFLRNA